MSRLLPVTVAIRTLRGQTVPARCRISVQQAREWLRQVSGEDFGEDAEAWSAWLRKNRWAYSRVPPDPSP